MTQLTFSPFTKPAVMRSKRYREFIASVPCLVCGHAAEPHHETFHCAGTGVKVSDLWCLPLSREWHTVHPRCRHRHPHGWKGFWWEHNIDPMFECLRLINWFFANGGKL